MMQMGVVTVTRAEESLRSRLGQQSGPRVYIWNMGVQMFFSQGTCKRTCVHVHIVLLLYYEFFLLVNVCYIVDHIIMCNEEANAKYISEFAYVCIYK